MDGYSEDRSEFDVPSGDAAAPAAPAHDAISSDERRMHVRAYNHWCSLLDGRDFPSVEDLEPADLADFGPHSVLLDFTAGIDNPATSYIGSAVREECGLATDGVRTIADVPSRSLLSRLTGHYMEIVANRAPVGFEAEFVNQRSHAISYRGILMPLSSDGDTIDFIYGVINWKDAGAAEPVVVAAGLAPIAAALAPAFDEPEAEEEEEEDILDLAVEGAEHHEHLTWEDGPLAAAEETLPAPSADADAGLADRLSAARACADVCKAADGRSRAALYRALALAYDFAVAARRVPGDYAEILDDAGVKAQARAPMTPIVKLVFGVDYDKTRVTEFAAALSHAERSAVDFGKFEAFVAAVDGGLKGLVAAERKARRSGAPAADKTEAGRDVLRGAAPFALADLASADEFALVIVRRNPAGGYDPVALVDDGAALEKGLRRAA